MTEFSDLYFNKMGYLKINKWKLRRAYIRLKRLIAKEYGDDRELMIHLKKLPGAYILHPWFAPVCVYLLLFMPIILNELIFRIDPEIYILSALIVVPLLLLLSRIVKKIENRMIRHLSDISSLAREKIE